ncbi:MAG: metallophosphoesterase [Candidatus Roizmanbacteria bacterium]
MKILHYSDHLDNNLVSYFGLCDVFLCTGDLSLFHFASIEKNIPLKDCFGVYGNHCNPGYLEQLGIQNVHLKILKWRNYSVSGFQGCLRYKESGGPQFTEDEANILLKDFPHVDILLLHAPPFGILDDPDDPVHSGSKSVRDYIDRTNPKYVFCGHLDPTAEVQYNNTTIFRTDGAKLFNLE